MGNEVNPSHSISVRIPESFMITQIVEPSSMPRDYVMIRCFAFRQDSFKQRSQAKASCKHIPCLASTALKKFLSQHWEISHKNSNFYSLLKKNQKIWLTLMPYSPKTAVDWAEEWLLPLERTWAVHFTIVSTTPHCLKSIRCFCSSHLHDDYIVFCVLVSNKSGDIQETKRATCFQREYFYPPRCICEQIR